MLVSPMSKHKVVVRNTFTSPKPRDGPGDMKLSKSETFNDLQDWVSGGQAHPRPSQQTIYSLTRRLGSSLAEYHGCTIFPKVTEVSLFLPSQLTSTFFNKGFLAGVSLPPASCLPRESPGA